VSSGIQVGVLGPFHVAVDGRAVTQNVQPSQRAILGLLAAAREPVSKTDVCRVVGVAPSSLDPQLSRLRSSLGAGRPVHRGRAPTSGFIALDRTVVTADVDLFLEHVSAGALAHARGDDREALARLLAADDLWRGPVFDGVVLIDDPTCQLRVATLTERLLAERHRCRDLAGWCWLAGSREGLAGDRLVRWAEELRDSAACWAAATRAVLERDGAHAATAVAERWRERASIHGDAASTGMYADVIRLLGGQPSGWGRLPAPLAERMQRAEASLLDGRWDEAERDYVTAADEVEASGDLVAEAEVALTMARLTWDPGRFEGKLEGRLVRVLDALPDQERLLQARIAACLAGGLYQDGSVDPERATPYARQALELAGELEDSLTAAEVLSHARRALMDVDVPDVQLERSRWIMSLAKGSDYHRSLGIVAAVVDLLLLGRSDEARELGEECREIADRSRSDYHRYFVAALDALWALYDRRYEAFEPANELAASLGGQWGMAVDETVQGQRLWAGYERSDQAFMRDAVPLIDAVAALGRPIPIWEVTAALFTAAIGESDEACRRLDRVARTTNDFREVRRGPLRLGTLALAALTCADLAAKGYNVRSTARGIYDELVANPAVGVPVGWPALYLGPKQQFVDLAADVVGDLR
jgi:hypothetical protein